MANRLRTLLIGLVMLAIPVQGFASASMLVCGPRHTQMAAAEARTHAEGAGARHDSATHAHAMHDPAKHGHGPEAPAAGEGSAPEDGSLLKIVKIKCLACAACGALSATAPAPSIATLGIAPAGALPIAFVTSSYAGVVPAGLERPPRLLLA